MTPPLDKKDLDPLWGLSYYVTVGTIVSSTHKTITTFSSRENIQSHEYVLQFEGFCMISLCTRIFLNFFYYPGVCNSCPPNGDFCVFSFLCKKLSRYHSNTSDTAFQRLDVILCDPDIIYRSSVNEVGPPPP